jgi:protein SCO1/2
VTSSLRVAAATIIVLAAAAWFGLRAHGISDATRLPEIGPAPEFSLTSQDGKNVSMAGLRGKVVVVAFIYASCADVCPLLTAKMAGLQEPLGSDFGRNVVFVSITVDPERDTPAVLARYARQHHAHLSAWSFLTGPRAEIEGVALRYGVVVRKTADGSVDHNLLTSIVDRRGILRVQYLGTRFDPDEFLTDLRSVLRERRSQ